MEHPVREIPGVITALCEGTLEEQVHALNDYFLPSAYFIHPFCRVPSFEPYPIPYVGDVGSRWLLQMVYQWYRILSPKIVFEIDSSAFDQRASLLYVTIRQRFSLWFIPFALWTAHVKLVTILELAHLPVDAERRPLPANRAAAPNGTDMRWFIKGQEDHYQVEEFLKFIAPWGAAILWQIWQLFATLLCVLGVSLFWPVTTFREYLIESKPPKAWTARATKSE